jgi:hypothetical protein
VKACASRVVAMIELFEQSMTLMMMMMDRLLSTCVVDDELMAVLCTTEGPLHLMEACLQKYCHSAPLHHHHQHDSYCFRKNSDLVL